MVWRTLSGFSESIPELARENDAALVPFLLQDVGGIPSLNQPDGLHPTAEGQRILAETVWRVLEPVLREKREREKQSVSGKGVEVAPISYPEQSEDLLYNSSSSASTATSISSFVL